MRNFILISQGTYNERPFIVASQSDERGACSHTVSPRLAPLYAHGEARINPVRPRGFGAAAWEDGAANPSFPAMGNLDSVRPKMIICAATRQMLPLQPRTARANWQAGSGRAWWRHRNLRMQKHLPASRCPAERAVPHLTAAALSCAALPSSHHPTSLRTRCVMC